jgi:hypothetical protein
MSCSPSSRPTMGFSGSPIPSPRRGPVGDESSAGPTGRDGSPRGFHLRHDGRDGGDLVIESSEQLSPQTGQQATVSSLWVRCILGGLDLAELLPLGQPVPLPPGFDLFRGPATIEAPRPASQTGSAPRRTRRWGSSALFVSGCRAPRICITLETAEDAAAPIEAGTATISASLVTSPLPPSS